MSASPHDSRASEESGVESSGGLSQTGGWKAWSLARCIIALCPRANESCCQQAVWSKEHGRNYYWPAPYICQVSDYVMADSLGTCLLDGRCGSDLPACSMTQVPCTIPIANLCSARFVTEHGKRSAKVEPFAASMARDSPWGQGLETCRLMLPRQRVSICAIGGKNETAAVVDRGASGPGLSAAVGNGSARRQQEQARELIPRKSGTSKRCKSSRTRSVSIRGVSEIATSHRGDIAVSLLAIAKPCRGRTQQLSLVLSKWAGLKQNPGRPPALAKTSRATPCKNCLAPLQNNVLPDTFRGE